MYSLDKMEKARIDREMYAFGHTTYDTDFFESDEYKKLASEMINNIPKRYGKSIYFKDCTKHQLLEAGKYIIDKHTQGTDTRVRYVDSDSLTADLYCIFGERPKVNKYDEIAKYIENNVELINVTNIPVQLNMFTNINGHVLNTWFYDSDNIKLDYYKKIKPAIKKIAIEGACDERTKTIYVHEMYHALTTSHKGSIKNLLYTEVLPIYMEKIATAEIDPTKEDIEALIRIQSLKNNLIDREHHNYNEDDNLRQISMEKYILSTAIATELYDTYRKGKREIKKELEDSINGIFKEEQTLEDVLNKFEVTPEKGSKILRRQIKKLSK